MDHANEHKTQSPAHTPVPEPVTVEADLKAGRRHRTSVEKFVESGRVEKAARDAEPSTPVEEEELFDAERKGEEHSKGEDPAQERPPGLAP